MREEYYAKGSWNVICDRCGFKFKASEVRKEWTGLFVCHTCWEPRHPQDFIRIPQEDITVPFVRPVGFEPQVNQNGSLAPSTLNFNTLNDFLLNG